MNHMRATPEAIRIVCLHTMTACSLPDRSSAEKVIMKTMMMAAAMVSASQGSHAEISGPRSVVPVLRIVDTEEKSGSC